MPSTIRFIGSAALANQIDTGTVGGTVEIGDLFKCTIGNKVVSIPATTTSTATTAQDIADAWAALDSTAYPEFKEIDAQANGSDVTFRALESGKPFTLTLTTTESNGAAADGQTWTKTSTIANGSPNDIGLAANYSGGVLPANDDTLVIDTDAPDLLWNLEALAAVTLTELIYKPPKTECGLPDLDRNGYSQYRPTFFKIKSLSVLIDTGSALCRFDFSSGETSVVIKNTGSSREQHRKACCIRGSNAANTISILKGSVGLAQLADESARFDDVRLGHVANISGDADVVCGTGCELATLLKNGGVLETNSNITVMTNRAGVWTHHAGTCGTADTQGGTSIYNSVGTLTTPKVSGSGILDFSRDPRAKTVTNPVEIFGPDAHLYDTANVINPAGSLVVDLNESASWANIHLGSHRRGTFTTPA